MYLSLSKKYLKDNQKSMEAAAILALGKEAECLLVEDLTDKMLDPTFEDGVLNVGVDTEAGYFGVDIPIDDELAFEIIAYMKLKGEKMKRLIKLAD